MKKSLLTITLSVVCSIAVLSQTILNEGFENWHTFNYTEPDSVWQTSNSQSIVRENVVTVSKVAGFSGFAAHIQTFINSTDTVEAYVSNGADPIAGIGGVPYSQRPTHFTGYYRYGLVGNDSAILIVTFKKNGTVVSSDVFMIGGSQATFTPFSFALTLSVVPDTVIIAAASSNLISGNGLGNGSWLELDNLAFTGSSITQVIPDGDFENWGAVSTFQQATDWAIQPAFNNLYGVTKTTDSHSGSYAIKLVTKGVPGSPSGGILYSSISTGQQSQYMGLYGGRPYTLTTDTLTGYYKFLAPSNDTGIVNIVLTQNGNNVGSIVYNLPHQTSYTYFEVPISASATPDTMRVDFYSSCWSYVSSSATAPGSSLFLDDLQLKSQLASAGVKAVNNDSKSINIFPNPVNDVLNFDLGNNQIIGDINIALYDMTGTLLKENMYTNRGEIIRVAVGELPPGIYIYKITRSNVSATNKFLKQ